MPPSVQSGPLSGESLYHDGVAWMNRGNHLQHSAASGELEAALHAYDQALLSFGRSADPAAPASRAAAAMNRGLCLLRLGACAQATEAFATARSLFAPLPLDRNPAHRCNAAAAALNHANALLQTRDPRMRPPAREATEEALRLAQPLARSDRTAAAVILAATELWCTAARGEWSGAKPEAVRCRERASDLLDDALVLVRDWESREPAAWLTLGRPVFRLTTALYLAHLPRFVPELLRENVDPLRAPRSWALDDEVRAIAATATESAWHFLQNERIRCATTPDEAQLAPAEELEAVIAHLREPAAA